MTAAIEVGRCDTTMVWLWSDGARDYTRAEGVIVRWRFVGERKWRKKTVVVDEEKGQTTNSLRAQKVAIAEVLARQVAAGRPERCPALSPDGEQCKYDKGHDATGQPHSWTKFGIGFPAAGRPE